LRASATLDQQMLSARRSLAGRLSGRDRAARCPTRKTCPASHPSRPPVGPAVNKLAAKFLFECRHGPPLFSDLQHLLLNEGIARPLGEFFAFPRLVAVLVGLALRHGTVPKNLDGV
jgi:hypothetical protein